MLKPGGRFVGEMGGEGNIAILRAGIRDELDRARLSHARRRIRNGIRASRTSPASIACAGFCEIDARLIPRPTPLPGGVAGWVKTFRAGLTGRRHGARMRSATRSPPRSRRGSRRALRQPDGSWIADYVRLRFSMRKPEA